MSLTIFGFDLLRTLHFESAVLLDEEGCSTQVLELGGNKG